MNSQKSLANVTGVSLTLSLIYAILRYNIFNDVPWKDLPVYVLNKAVSLAIIILIFYDQYTRNNKKFKNNVWFTIIVLAVFHLLLSVSILIPAYFEKFYDLNQLNIIGSLSILFGVLAFGGFLVRGIF